MPWARALVCLVPRLPGIGSALLALAGTACATGGHRTGSMGGLDAQTVVTASRRGAPGVSTAIYRDLVARTLYSRCQMYPSDSELYDRRARACGATSAAVLGAARLLLEVEASPEVLPVTFADGRLRWLDAPLPSHACTP